MAILTATLCTTFVKLPVALSGGNSANCDPDAGAIEFPSGWRLILASLQRFKLTRRGDDDDLNDEQNEDDQNH